MKRLITSFQALAGWHKQRDLQVPRVVLVYPHERAKWDAIDQFRLDLHKEIAAGNPSVSWDDTIAGVQFSMTFDQPRYPRKTRT